ncbi:MAG TPA: glycosyltransferase family 2 protein [Steroidobacteraceae bacterium]|nr:glycosyltransferase family 2 protein [Steroidobacteraceae bacterium]
MLVSLETLFWISLVVGLYPYAGYPLCIALLKAVRPRPVRVGSVTPTVTVVISAYNEVSHIGATVRNKLTQDYPATLLDVMVVSDGSTDGTDEVLQQLASQEARVSYLRQEPRGGKTAALNAVVERARGEIIVFSDANSMYRPDTVRRLVEGFADPEVGYASGRMLYVDPRGSLVGDGCTAYMRYENRLRRYESAIGSVVGVDGAVDAIRRSLYRPMRSDQLPDFVLPLSVVEQGYRVVYAPQAVLEEETLTNESQEYRMRVRVALRALWALWDKRALLNPLRFPLFSWQLASHKLLRYLSFAPLAVAAICSWLLVPRSGLYLALTAGQGVAAALALAATLGPKQLRAFPVTRYCYYFVLLNWASAVAFGRFVRGDKQVVWQPRTG